jgi:hypothetical protein
VNGQFELAGTLLKFTRGACFSAYAPEVQTVEPAAGRSSENPVKVWPAATSSVARFSVDMLCYALAIQFPSHQDDGIPIGEET